MSDDFLNAQQQAAEELLEMSRRSKYKSTRQQKEEINHNATSPPVLNIKLPQGIAVQSDALLILGIILILSSEKSDKWLFLALLYILI